MRVKAYEGRGQATVSVGVRGCSVWLSWAPRGGVARAVLSLNDNQGVGFKNLRRYLSESSLQFSNLNWTRSLVDSADCVTPSSPDRNLSSDETPKRIADQTPMTTPAMVIGTVCKERIHLLEEYRKAAEEYFAAAMRELEHYRGVLSTADYEQLRKGVDQAKHFADRARRILLHHIAEHRC